MKMKQYKLINIIAGWAVFLIATVVYLMTIEPTTSFWDCGEFIASAYKLEVGHPPGAPFFMLIGRFFTLFTSDPAKVPVMINALSALASSFTILFLFWTITHLAKRIFIKNNEFTTGNVFAVIGAGVVGALAYTFSDTFWFSAVEGEVYASSSLFTAIVFWAILKWENVADQKHADRWLLLIIYLMGLSIGVHLLNLLAIPAIVFVYYFKKYKPSTRGIVLASVFSVIILALIMWGLIPGLVTKASKFELLFVNKLGLPFNSGVIFYILFLVVALVAGIYITHVKKANKIVVASIFALIIFLGVTGSIGLSIFIAIVAFGLVYYFADKHKAVVNTVILGFAMIIIGYSSFAIIIIRSNANPPMDQNNPETFFNLLSYLNREQYGDRPLMSGYYYNVSPVRYDRDNSRPIYEKNEETGKYKIVNYKTEYVYDSKDSKVFFPRVWASTKPQHKGDYEYWARGSGWKGKPEKSERELNKPISYGENIRFFVRYQIGYMYMRYFMWNFAGRQNDIQGHGEATKGNWISGISFIDNMRLGDQDKLPSDLKNNPAKNRYYFLPLILGLLGIFYQYKKSKKDLSVVSLLFFFTGIAIVIYLNQDPHQPRERDYAYAGSFYAFAIWIGLGVLMLIDLLRKKLPVLTSAILVTLVSTILVPGIMAKENWNDHDRSGCYTARDFAFNYLESCEPNAILFTNGDNDTFPLWYAQEVEEKRTDVRVINLSYLTADWYIEQMYRKVYDSDPVPFSLSKDEFRNGSNDMIRVENWFNKPITLEGAFKYALNKEYRDGLLRQDKIRESFMNHFQKYGQNMNQLISRPHFPTNRFVIPVDSAKVMKNGVVRQEFADDLVDAMVWKIGDKNIMKNKLMVLNLLANNDWERPVYYAITVAPSNFLNLEDYFQQHGLAYKIVPVKADGTDGHIGGIDTKIMYNKMMNKFVWGGVDDPDVYLNENNRRMMTNMRSNFVRLARALVKENKNDSARNVLARCNELISEDIVPYSIHSLRMAQAFAQMGDTASANEIIKGATRNSVENITFYQSLPEKLKNKYLEGDMNREIAIAQEVIRTATSINNGIKNVGEFSTDFADILDKSMQILEKEPTIRKFLSMQSDQQRLSEWYSSLSPQKKNMVSIFFNCRTLRDELVVPAETEETDSMELGF